MVQISTEAVTKIPDICPFDGVGTAPTNASALAGKVHERSDRAISRRRMFEGFATLAGLYSVAASAKAAPPSEVSADVDPGSLLNKLVRRITMGYTPEEAALAHSLGYQGYLEYHLNHLAIDDSAIEARMNDASHTTLSMTPQQLYTLTVGQIISELTDAAVLRSALSKRQLFERMVEFWTDHFNIDINKEDARYLKTIDDRDVIRANALTTVPQIVSASAHSPAMLIYLDNDISVAGNPNENYARELMELHTLGVDGGYTQQDVVEVARCFTGWTYNRRPGTQRGTFQYNASTHDNGQKVVMGMVIPAGGGMQDGLTVLNMLTSHPNTARYISKKLVKWLVGESAPQSVVDSVVSAYTSTGGDIKAMIRAALAPNVLADAAPRFKRPYHHAISALRAVQASIGVTQAIRSSLSSSGHVPFQWGTPDGYPDQIDYWSGLLITRWNFGASIGQNAMNGVTLNLTAFFAGATTADQMADRINTNMFGGEMTANERNRIRDYLLPNPPTTSRQREALGLAIAAPTFQWY